jgi:hypothetical protein
MINYRVQNLEILVEELRNEGVTIVDSIETFNYGKFIYIYLIRKEIKLNPRERILRCLLRSQRALRIYLRGSKILRSLLRRASIMGTG